MASRKEVKSLSLFDWIREEVGVGLLEKNHFSSNQARLDVRALR